MELEQETFETVKELAALGTEVATAKANLDKLQKDTEEFFKEREEVMQNRINTVLLNAQGLLTETNQYHDQFKSFLASTRDVSEKITAMVSSLSTLRDDTSKYSESFNGFLAESLKKISDERCSIQKAHDALKAEKKFIDTKKENIRKEQIKIADEWAEVKRAIERLNKGKI